MRDRHRQLAAADSRPNRIQRSGLATLLAGCLTTLMAMFSPSLAALENWERFVGGDNRDTSFAVASFPDGSVISAGYTRSSGNGDADIQLLKLDKSGAITWQKTYGGKARDMATAVASLPDGGWVTAAVSHQRGEKGAKGHDDALIMRHDKAGQLLWQKRVGGSNYDIPYAIKVNQSGHIVVVGYTKSKGQGDADGWVFSLDPDGELLWERTYGGKGRDWFRSLTLLPDGDIVVAGGTKADRKANIHTLAMRLDKRGDKIWSRTFEGDENVGRAIVPLDNGGVAVAGWVHRKNGITGRDIWVAKLDKDGKTSWEKVLGGSGDDHTEALIALPGGDIALAGGTTKNLAVLTVRAAWMLRLNKRGKLMWRRAFEGKSDQLFGLSSLPDGNLVACGTSWRDDSGADAWILTLDKYGRRANRPAIRQSKTSIR